MSGMTAGSRMVVSRVSEKGRICGRYILTCQGDGEVESVVCC